MASALNPPVDGAEFLYIFYEKKDWWVLWELPPAFASWQDAALRAIPIVGSLFATGAFRVNPSELAVKIDPADYADANIDPVGYGLSQGYASSDIGEISRATYQNMGVLPCSVDNPYLNPGGPTCTPDGAPITAPTDPSSSPAPSTPAATAPGSPSGPKSGGTDWDKFMQSIGGYAGLTVLGLAAVFMLRR